MGSGEGADVTVADTLAVFERLEQSSTPLTTAEVADALDCHRQRARRSLDRLVDRGVLQTKETGPESRIWWHPAEATATTDIDSPWDEDDQFAEFVRSVEDYAIFVLDPKGYVASWNDGAKRIKGYDADEIVGEHFSTFYTDEDTERGVPERNLAAAEASGRIESEGWRVRNDGSEFWANVTITAIRDDDGSLKGFTKVTRDLTERKQREEELRRENELTEHLLRTAPVAITVQDGDGETVMANQRAQDVLGLSEQEIVGDPADRDEWEFYDGDGNPLAPSETPMARVYETGEALFNEEIAIDRPGRDRLWISVNTVPQFDSEGSLERIISASEDITELKRQEAQLRRERDFVDQILAAAPLSILVVNRDGSIEKLNQRARNRLGLEESGEYAIGDQLVYDADGDPIPLSERPYMRVFETGDPVTDWEGQIDLPGGRAWMSVTAVPFGDESPPEHVVLAVKDITKLRTQAEQLERQRAELEAELDEVYDRITDGFIALDEEWRFTHVNEAAEELIEREEAAVLGESVWEAFPQAETGVVWEKAHEAMETQEPVSFDWYNESLEAWVEIHAYPSETGMSIYVRDVTERVESERELEARARQQWVVSELSRRALEDTDLDALFEGAARLVADVLDNEYAKVLDLDQSNDELLLRQGVGWDDGIVGTGTVSAIEDDSQASYTLRSKEPVVVDDLATESRFSGPDLLRAHGVSSGISTIIGSYDDPWGILGTHDTERKSFTDEDVTFVQSVANILAEAIERHAYQTELEELVAELEASNERLESFASMLAHELRNPVTIGHIYSRQLPDETDSDAVEYVTDAFDRIETMIDVMLVLARGNDAVDTTESVNLAEMAREAWDDVGGLSASLDIDLDMTVQADETYLQHLFANLYRNAVEHGGEDVSIAVGELSSGFYVEDDGIGIPEDDRDSVFEVGYTTAAEQGGTGLGLAFVRELTEAYGWECRITESESGGARFEFRCIGEDT
ncbi:PAS domain S-box protein [Haloarcula nitratireducens]|uniref:histidine kinase n=1 Tax=Haloarcula nitratireducens TaxID=2487749 RepID=A0AAW4PGH9_9EURY|nr:PAS domain S-box protein [Halomicroarcula nitratireducens]MBX0296405.1 PAS domain S-box protein [Halomicroarcula nitratireducens]